MNTNQQKLTKPKQALPRILDKIKVSKTASNRQPKRRIRKRISAPCPKTPNSFWTADITLDGGEVSYEYSQANSIINDNSNYPLTVKYFNL